MPQSSILEVDGVNLGRMYGCDMLAGGDDAALCPSWPGHHNVWCLMRRGSNGVGVRNRRCREAEGTGGLLCNTFWLERYVHGGGLLAGVLLRLCRQPHMFIC